MTESSVSKLPLRGDLAYYLYLSEVRALLVEFDDDEIDKEKAAAYALKGEDEARRSMVRLTQRLEDREARPEAPAAERTEGAKNDDARPPDKDDLPATKKQLSYLEALVEDVVEDGDAVEKFEEMVGKPIGELTRGEASEWIGRLSGRAV